MHNVIVGAGLAGLIAACKLDGEIIEAGQRIEQHKALLRFRDESVSTLTGIPFKKVTVRKEINYKGDTFTKPTIALANLYSQKVVGTISGRSIWNLDTVERYVAPEDFYDQLVDRHEKRIHWGQSLDEDTMEGNIISTAPLPVIMKICDLDTSKFEFKRSAIKVDRYKLPAGSDIYQTIYFPEERLSVFRASITGDILIVESMINERSQLSHGDIYAVVAAFGLNFDQLVTMDSVDQKYGKIIDLPRADREAILYELTRDFNIFSLGRFATWRNILLDDVVHDINVVSRLIEASGYGRERVLAKR